MAAVVPCIIFNCIVVHIIKGGDIHLKEISAGGKNKKSMETKYIVCEKMEQDDDTGTIVGWGSKPTVDRDKELIESSAWNLDGYRKNPVLLLCHKYDTPPVGKCLWVKSTPQGLRFKAQFAKTERGKECYQLYKDGIMNAFSVGFKPRNGGVIDNPTDVKYKGMGIKRVFTDVDLMEISCVPVPANSEALVEWVKAGNIQTKQLKDELELIIEILDEEVEIKAKKEDEENPSPSKEAETDANGEEPGEGVTAEEDEAEAEVAVGMTGENKPAESDEEVEEDEMDEEEEEEEKKKKKKESSEIEHNGFMIPAEVKEEIEELLLKNTASEDLITELKETISALEDQSEQREEDLPSIYDITKAINEALYDDDFVNSIVDFLPLNYPSGLLIYSQYDPETEETKYFHIPYEYGYDDTVTLGEEENEIEQKAVEDKYPTNEYEEETLVKSGRAISAKNRALLQQAIDVIAELIADKVEPPVDEMEEKDEEKFELDVETKEDNFEFDFDEKADDGEIDLEGLDADEIKSIIDSVFSKADLKIDAKNSVREALAKITGKAVLDD